MIKEPDPSSYVVHSHDALFKCLMQDKAIALEFVEYYLPENIKAICDLNTLAIEPNSFVEPDLKQRFNDVLYSVNTNNSKEKGYIYCLIEHQSKPDRFIAFRLMHYAIMAMESHLKQGNKKLPLVVPILFYSGKKAHPMHIPLDWHELFEDPNMAKTVYCNPFKIIDVNNIDDDELKKHNRLGVLEYLLKHSRTRDLINIFNELIQAFVISLFNKEQQKTILIYLLNQGKIDNQDIERFLDELAQTQLGDDTMAMTTVADYLREQGRKQGMQIGEQQGRQEGLQNATFTIARNMLKNGANVQFVKLTTGLSEEEIKKLQQ